MDVLAALKFPSPRSYALSGPENARAVSVGLANAAWYRTPIERKLMRALMQRSDARALRDTAIWLGLLLACAAGGSLSWGSWMAVPFWIAYGVLYGSAADSRWHECGHGTAFKTKWLNDAVYELASFMMMRNAEVWRWSHTRHHSDTIIVGRDPEISAMRPPQLIIMCLNLLGLVSVPLSLIAIGRNALGRLSADEADYVPAHARRRVFLTARLHMAIYAATLLACVMSGSVLPAMLIGLPRCYGVWLLLVMGLPQHMGLADDILDHRLNSRTVLMNPVLRFIYSNMNYHVEHHMYPLVPYHALLLLHDAVKHDCPAPDPSLWYTWRQIIPTALRQLQDPAHFIRRTLPSGAGR